MNMVLSNSVIRAAVSKVIAEDSAGMLDNFEVGGLRCHIGGTYYNFDNIEVVLKPKPEPKQPVVSITRETSTGKVMRLAACDGERVQ